MSSNNDVFEPAHGAEGGVNSTVNPETDECGSFSGEVQGVRPQSCKSSSGLSSSISSLEPPGDQVCVPSDTGKSTNLLFRGGRAGINQDSEANTQDDEVKTNLRGFSAMGKSEDSSKEGDNYGHLVSPITPDDIQIDPNRESSESAVSADDGANDDNENNVVSTTVKGSIQTTPGVDQVSGRDHNAGGPGVDQVSGRDHNAGGLNQKPSQQRDSGPKEPGRQPSSNHSGSFRNKNSYTHNSSKHSTPREVNNPNNPNQQFNQGGQWTNQRNNYWEQYNQDYNNQNQGGYNNDQGGGYNNNQYQQHQNQRGQNNYNYGQYNQGYVGSGQGYGTQNSSGYNNNQGGYNQNQGGYNNNQSGYNNNQGHWNQNNPGFGYGNPNHDQYNLDGTRVSWAGSGHFGGQYNFGHNPNDQSQQGQDTQVQAHQLDPSTVNQTADNDNIHTNVDEVPPPPPPLPETVPPPMEIISRQSLSKNSPSNVYKKFSSKNSSPLLFAGGNNNVLNIPNMNQVPQRISQGNNSNNNNLNFVPNINPNSVSNFQTHQVHTAQRVSNDRQSSLFQNNAQQFRMNTPRAQQGSWSSSEDSDKISGRMSLDSDARSHNTGRKPLLSRPNSLKSSVNAFKAPGFSSGDIKPKSLSGFGVKNNLCLQSHSVSGASVHSSSLNKNNNNNFQSSTVKSDVVLNKNNNNKSSVFVNNDNFSSVNQGRLSHSSSSSTKKGLVQPHLPNVEMPFTTDTESKKSLIMVGKPVAHEIIRECQPTTMTRTSMGHSIIQESDTNIIANNNGQNVVKTSTKRKKDSKTKKSELSANSASSSTFHPTSTVVETSTSSITAPAPVPSRIRSSLPRVLVGAKDIEHLPDISESEFDENIKNAGKKTLPTAPTKRQEWSKNCIIALLNGRTGVKLVPDAKNLYGKAPTTLLMAIPLTYDLFEPKDYKKLVSNHVNNITNRKAPVKKLDLKFKSDFKDGRGIVLGSVLVKFKIEDPGIDLSKWATTDVEDRMMVEVQCIFMSTRFTGVFKNKMSSALILRAMHCTEALCTDAAVSGTEVLVNGNKITVTSFNLFQAARNSAADLWELFLSNRPLFSKEIESKIKERVVSKKPLNDDNDVTVAFHMLVSDNDDGAHSGFEDNDNFLSNCKTHTLRPPITLEDKNETVHSDYVMVDREVNPEVDLVKDLTAPGYQGGNFHYYSSKNSPSDDIDVPLVDFIQVDQQYNNAPHVEGSHQHQPHSGIDISLEENYERVPMSKNPNAFYNQAFQTSECDNTITQERLKLEKDKLQLDMDIKLQQQLQQQQSEMERRQRESEAKHKELLAQQLTAQKLAFESQKSAIDDAANEVAKLKAQLAAHGDKRAKKNANKKNKKKSKKPDNSPSGSDSENSIRSSSSEESSQSEGSSSKKGRKKHRASKKARDAKKRKEQQKRWEEDEAYKQSNENYRQTYDSKSVRFDYNTDQSKDYKDADDVTVNAHSINFSNQDPIEGRKGNPGNNDPLPWLPVLGKSKSDGDLSYKCFFRCIRRIFKVVDPDYFTDYKKALECGECNNLCYMEYIAYSQWDDSNSKAMNFRPGSLKDHVYKALSEILESGFTETSNSTEKYRALVNFSNKIHYEVGLADPETIAKNSKNSWSKNNYKNDWNKNDWNKNDWNKKDWNNSNDDWNEGGWKNKDDSPDGKSSNSNDNNQNSNSDSDSDAEWQKAKTNGKLVKKKTNHGESAEQILQLYQALYITISIHVSNNYSLPDEIKSQLKKATCVSGSKSNYSNFWTKLIKKYESDMNDDKERHQRTEAEASMRELHCYLKDLLGPRGPKGEFTEPPKKDKNFYQDMMGLVNNCLSQSNSFKKFHYYKDRFAQLLVHIIKAESVHTTQHGIWSQLHNILSNVFIVPFLEVQVVNDASKLGPKGTKENAHITPFIACLKVLSSIALAICRELRLDDDYVTNWAGEKVRQRYDEDLWVEIDTLFPKIIKHGRGISDSNAMRPPIIQGPQLEKLKNNVSSFPYFPPPNQSPFYNGQPCEIQEMDESAMSHLLKYKPMAIMQKIWDCYGQRTFDTTEICSFEDSYGGDKGGQSDKHQDKTISVNGILLPNWQLFSPNSMPRYWGELQLQNDFIPILARDSDGALAQLALIHDESFTKDFFKGCPEASILTKKDGVVQKRLFAKGQAKPLCALCVAAQLAESGLIPNGKKCPLGESCGKSMMWVPKSLQKKLVEDPESKKYFEHIGALSVNLSDVILRHDEDQNSNDSFKFPPSIVRAIKNGNNYYPKYWPSWGFKYPDPAGMYNKINLRLDKFPSNYSIEQPLGRNQIQVIHQKDNNNRSWSLEVVLGQKKIGDLLPTKPDGSKDDWKNYKYDPEVDGTVRNFVDEATMGEWSNTYMSLFGQFPKENYQYKKDSQDTWTNYYGNNYDKGYNNNSGNSYQNTQGDQNILGNQDNQQVNRN